jgi:DICT domain-containing protein
MSPDFYRKEAERLRRLADTQTDSVVVQKLRQIAAENDVLAMELEASKNNSKSGY